MKCQKCFLALQFPLQITDLLSLHNEWVQRGQLGYLVITVCKYTLDIDYRVLSILVG